MKPGKQTEVGDIPDDWIVTRIGDIATVKDGTHQTPRYVPVGIPFYSVEHVTSGNFDDTKFITVDEHKFLTRSFRMERGDILMTRIGSIGDCKLIDWDVDASFYVSLALLKIHGASSAYFEQYSKTHSFKREVELHSLASAIPRKINLGPISDVKIVLPPPAEQSAIASALSDVDALLSSLDALIAKKRDIKQAAMQQLLTGKTRLPGFEGEWAVTRLGDHATLIRNGVYSRAELSIDGSVKYLHYGDIHTSGAVHLNPSNAIMPFLDADKAVRLGRLVSGDLVFVDATEDLAGVGKSVEIVGAEGTEVVAGLHTIAVRFEKRILADGFKAYLQFIPAFGAHLRSLAAGTKVLSTNRSHIASAEIALPSIAEQAAIAQVLSDMDVELAALEARRDKTRLLKQGMMQELLTGKTRLV
ncbi:restriction endonuclease subunit S [Burkholderia pseudomallei]|uniref:restriction endonuclease subunit S n=1 Tax=Burkholderia pseudomallei TaxID=28450 RepID=UPI000976274E|nr:restriction endonuclease subunit S [Burkholderia pseudomallei]MDV2141228.1 restriction endonuclease subunit S [Burkholderia pseudomallei]MDV2172236.1 restriction endonuclease subunit S [Burkholderia pseudomallei]MDV2206641.1 restriction endonuclease subunit S [Burkholderia pseudomallei]MDV2213430.1 restriction endonuclease subunit S [Burkholderia pseudomallei]CAJ2789981.1 restriction endonuclease S subunits-like protein [Burkholderia pseudomallei]